MSVRMTVLRHELILCGAGHRLPISCLKPEMFCHNFSRYPRVIWKLIRESYFRNPLFTVKYSTDFLLAFNTVILLDMPGFFRVL